MAWLLRSVVPALPGPAVVHLAGLPRHPRELSGGEVVTLRLSAAGFRRLVDYLDATFERRGGARARPSARKS